MHLHLFRVSFFFFQTFGMCWTKFRCFSYHVIFTKEMPMKHPLHSSITHALLCLRLFFAPSPPRDMVEEDEFATKVNAGLVHVLTYASNGEKPRHCPRRRRTKKSRASRHQASRFPVPTPSSDSGTPAASIPSFSLPKPTAPSSKKKATAPTTQAICLVKDHITIL
jgi:hypothetical protein